MALQKLIQKKASLQEIASFLDSLEKEERVKECLSLRGKEQALLWEIAGSEKRELELRFFVPPAKKPLSPVPFEGKNSLPFFTRFQKIFYRTKEGTIGGYNRQPLIFFTGPGYYLLEKSAEEAPGPLVINYLRVPRSKPKDFPPLQSNNAFPARFIYGGMTDYLRRVSEDVVIGRAYRRFKKPLPNYFVLVRP